MKECRSSKPYCRASNTLDPSFFLAFIGVENLSHGSLQGLFKFPKAATNSLLLSPPCSKMPHLPFPASSICCCYFLCCPGAGGKLQIHSCPLPPGCSGPRLSWDTESERNSSSDSRMRVPLTCLVPLGAGMGGVILFTHCCCCCCSQLS